MSNIDNEAKIKQIISTDIVANENAIDLDENRNILNDSNQFISEEIDVAKFLSDKNFFSQYDWLIKDKKKEKMKLLLHWCEVFGPDNLKEIIDDSKETNINQKQIYLYFIALEDDNMFLYADFYMESDQVIKKCIEKYEFVKKNAPGKVVYNMIISDLYDIDKNVKLFMHIFGIESIRGGSYTDVSLSYETEQCILNEKKITRIEYFTI